MSAVRGVLLATALAVAVVVPELFGHPLVAAAAWGSCLVVLAGTDPRGALSLSFLYLLLLGVFHLGLVVPIALGLGPEHPPTWVGSPHVPTALSLFSTAAIAFTLGARLGPDTPEGVPELPAHRPLFRVGSAVAVVGAAILWIGVSQAGLLSRGYSVYFERALTQDVRLFGFGLMLFPIGLLVAATGATRRRMYVLGAGLAIVLGPLFFAGFRGPVIVQATALLAVWAWKSAPAARRLAAVFLVTVALAGPAIRATRDKDAAEPPSGDKSVLALFHETGGSLYPLVITVERIESGAEPLWAGRSYAMAADRVALNVSRRWTAPTVRALTPNHWATMHGDPWAFEHGGGVGFSGVAEPYLNFGRAGMTLFFVLLGAVIRRCERWFRADPFRAAAAAASFGFVLWTVRNDAMEVVRAAAFATGTVLAAWALTRLGERRGGAPRPVDYGAGEPLTTTHQR